MVTTIQLPTYRYRLEFRRSNGTRLLEVPLEAADFGPAVDAAFLDGLRRGVFHEYQPPTDGVRLEPTFVRDGSPLTSGFTVVLPTEAGGEHRAAFGPGVLRSLARRVVVDLARDGQLGGEATFLFQLSAYLEDERPAPRRGMVLTLEAAEPLVPIRDKARAMLGPTVAWDEPREEDLPVLILRSVLEDALGEARRYPEREVGGFLLGHLCRDPGSGELFLEVTCHVPAEGTEATETSVTFTPASWEHARAVIRLRGEGEIFVGWVHSHPFSFCAECAAPFKADCVSKVLFFSSEDTFLMELAFAQPFMVALQTAIEPRLEQALGHLPVRLYGWRNATVGPRGFEVSG